MEKQNTNNFTYPHARSEVSSDVVIFGYEPDNEIHLLLVRKRFSDSDTGGFTEWALPGSFIHGANEQNDIGKGKDSWEYGDGVESLGDSVRRALSITIDAKINENEFMKLPVWEYKPNDINEEEWEEDWEFLPPRTDPRRDERGKRVISLPVMVFVKMDRMKSYQEKLVRWVPVSMIEKDNPYYNSKEGRGEFKLPFDHPAMYYDGIERLRQIVRVQPIGREILGKKFTINQLLKFYEAIFGGAIEKTGFRKWLLDDSRKLIEELKNEYDRSSSNRPAQYYQFNNETYERLRRTKELGFNPTVTKKNRNI